MNKKKGILNFLYCAIALALLSACTVFVDKPATRTPPAATIASTATPSSQLNGSPTSIATQVPTATNSQTVATALANEGCIRSFHAFAYTLPEWNPNMPVEKVLPPPPWQIESALPTWQVEGYHILSSHVELARSVNGHQEIWIIQELLPIESGTGIKNAFAVYQVESQKWEFVSANIGDTDLLARDLFVTSDGSVWGKTVWDPTQRRSSPEEAPALSRLNEDTQRFEFAPGVPEVLLARETNYPDWPEIVLDSQDVFWIFVHNDRLYRYDSTTQTTEKEADLSGYYVTQPVLS